MGIEMTATREKGFSPVVVLSSPSDPRDRVQRILDGIEGKPDASDILELTYQAIGADLVDKLESIDTKLDRLQTGVNENALRIGQLEKQLNEHNKIIAPIQQGLKTTGQGMSDGFKTLVVAILMGLAGYLSHQVVELVTYRPTACENLQTMGLAPLELNTPELQSLYGHLDRDMDGFACE